ncbi:MAG: MnmC family methyltransferase [Zetaproteobacteria bacterium]|nr:MnmC family methyltransferase [Zetaproteobacteria bacterium]
MNLFADAQDAKVVTHDGSITLYNHEVGECYHSKGGALAEAQNLYIGGSGLCQRLQVGHHGVLSVADIGLGLGYNACSTLAAWESQETVPDLQLTSFESDTKLIRDLLTGRGSWQSNWDHRWLGYVCRFQLGGLSSGPLQLLTSSGRHPHSLAQYTWTIVISTASSNGLRCLFDQELASVPKFDFIWQDAFSPLKNPDLWSADWFEALRAHSQGACTLMTYSVARQVRDALTQSGWQWQKVKAGPGTKRHWLRANPTA